jgi:hypothetical protein
VLLKKKSSHGVRENEPPLEAWVIIPPGAPYIGSLGDKGCPTQHYACTMYTIAELTTGVLSHCSAIITAVPYLVLWLVSWSWACPILTVLGVLSLRLLACVFRISMSSVLSSS